MQSMSQSFSSLQQEPTLTGEGEPARRTIERDEGILDIVNSYDSFNLLGYLRCVGNLYQWILFMFVNIVYHILNECNKE